MRLLVTTVLAFTIALAATLLPAAAASAAGGRTHGDPSPFKKGCRTYTYDYRIWAPTQDWTLEVFIRNPRGKGVYSDAWLGKPGRQGHPKRQKNVKWTMCSRSSRPGLYKIRAKFVWYEHHDGLPLLPPPPPEEHVKWLPVERFRIHR